jgi:uncharacterized protein (DUF111 family)
VPYLSNFSQLVLRELFFKYLDIIICNVNIVTFYENISIVTNWIARTSIDSSPEYESCRVLAKKTGKPLKEIYRDAIPFFSRR